MRCKWLYVVAMCAGVLLAAGGIFAIYKRDVLFVLFRPFIADHIIAIQDFRKLSNILFLPQILFEREAVPLPTYELVISKRDLARLKEQLPQGDYTEIEAAGKVFNAISDINKFSVSGTFLHEGESYPVDVRFRGTTYNHWYFPKKSWHIKFKGESPVGMQQINLIIPEDRGYLNEEMNHYRGRKFGLFVPRSGFVNLTVDGMPEGVYWWAEDWSPNMLQNLGKSGCLFGAGLSRDSKAMRDPAFDNSELWKDYTNCGVNGTTKLKELLSLLNLSKNEFPIAAEKILDIRKVLMWDAMARLAGSGHGGYGYNMRVFWDKTTGKFEFVPWDLGFGDLSGTELNSYYNEFITRLLEHDIYVTERNEILQNYVGNKKNLKDDLAFYDSLVASAMPSFYRDSIQNESILELREKIAAGRMLIQGNMKKINGLLANTPAVHASVR